MIEKKPMLRVKAKPKESKLEGIGLFAEEFIPAGTITWQYDADFDTAFDPETYDRLEENAKELFLKHSYFDYKLEKYILCSDNQRFINHSENPNIKSTPEQDVAIIDIQIGEELLCTYSDYEPDWFERRKINRADFKKIEE